MARIVSTLSLRFRHRWLGMAFIHLIAVPAALGWEAGPRTVKIVSGIAYHLMGPTIVAD